MEETAGRKSEDILEGLAKRGGFRITQEIGRIFDAAVLGESHDSIAQSQTDQAAMRAAGRPLVEELLEASFRDAAEGGELRQIVTGPAGAVFPVPDEFQFPEHTAPQESTKVLIYTYTKVADLTKNRPPAEKS